MEKFKIFYIAFLFSILGVSASCSLEGDFCTATTDIDVIRQPFKPIYNEYGGNADFGDDPVVRISPADRSHIHQTFRTQNEMQNRNNYDSNCQFGVCLPSDMQGSLR